MDSEVVHSPEELLVNEAHQGLEGQRGQPESEVHLAQPEQRILHVPTIVSKVLSPISR